MSTLAVVGGGRPRWRRTLAEWAIAAAGALLVGAASVHSPLMVMLLVCAATVVVFSLRLTSWVLVAALLTLAYLPESIVGGGPLGRPELQKGFLFFAVAVMMAARGVRPKFLLPVVAYAALAVLAAAHGVMPGLTIEQMASSFVTLTLSWALLSIKWDWDRDLKFLKAVAVVPVVSVLLGAVLYGIGLHPLFESGGGAVINRLTGASIPAQLALGSFIGSFAGYVLLREAKWRPGGFLMGIDAAILLLTLTRGPAVALGIAFLWPALRFGLGSFGDNPLLGYVRFLAVLAVCAIAAVAIIPALQSRESGSRYYPGQTIQRDKSSGRSEAWKETYRIAKREPLFGHGLGAGPITKIDVGGFKAQHNEYLRLFLEGGYVGGGLVLLAIILAIGMAIASAPRRLRPDLVGLALAVAFLSATDNTLNSPAHAVALCVVLGLCASRGRSTTVAPPPARPLSSLLPTPRRAAVSARRGGRDLRRAVDTWVSANSLRLWIWAALLATLAAGMWVCVQTTTLLSTSTPLNSDLASSRLPDVIDAALKAETFLSEPGMAVVVVIAVAAVAYRQGGAALALLAPAAAGVAAVASFAKEVADPTSLPSGHTAWAVAVFGLAAWLMLREGMPRLAVVLATIGLAMGPTLVVEEVHYPADVVAGTVLGIAWLFVVILLGAPRRTAEHRERQSAANNGAGGF